MKQPSGLNPFLPFSTYIPDGEPKVFGGRLYLYGSYDLFNGGYCSDVYHVVSAPLDDLTAWTDHGVSFRAKDVPWSDALLYAPDVLFHGGKYYLYFCLSDGSEGVAESDSPAGPFRNARRITLNGAPIEGIDPSVLEYDGHIYYTWGQFHLKVGELKEDLCTLIPESIHDDVLSNAPGREGFHEGSSLRRFGGRYCMIYASEYTDVPPNSGSRPTKLDYALGDSPYGPYLRRGTVIDNTGCDPQSWNDHGSIIRVKDEWFVFYHASSNNSAFSRRARAERLQVDEEKGTIGQAVPSTNGFVKTLLPEHIISPVNARLFFGGAYVTETLDGRFPCVGLTTGAGFEFSPTRFRAGSYELTIRYRCSRNVRFRFLLNAEKAFDGVMPKSDTLREMNCHFTVPEGFFTPGIRVLESFEGADAEIDLLEFKYSEIERCL